MAIAAYNLTDITLRYMTIGPRNSFKFLKLCFNHGHGVGTSFHDSGPLDNFDCFTEKESLWYAVKCTAVNGMPGSPIARER